MLYMLVFVVGWFLWWVGWFLWWWYTSSWPLASDGRLCGEAQRAPQRAPEVVSNYRFVSESSGSMMFIFGQDDVYFRAYLLSCRFLVCVCSSIITCLYGIYYLESSSGRSIVIFGRDYFYFRERGLYFGQHDVYLRAA